MTLHSAGSAGPGEPGEIEKVTASSPISAAVTMSHIFYSSQNPTSSLVTHFLLHTALKQIESRDCMNLMTLELGFF
jgi:hypothetical protein